MCAHSSIPVASISRPLCARRPESDRDDCRVDAQRALIPVNLACMSAMRDSSVCENPAGGRGGKPTDRDGEKKSRCMKENKRMVECLLVSGEG